MNESSSWFEDETLFVREVKRVLSAPRGGPEITGYADVREIARGGQGVVYSALQVSTRRIVAIKVLRDTPQDGMQGTQRFAREVALAASLRHPYLVALYDSGSLADGRPYLVMELVDGPTLEHAPVVLAAQEHKLARPQLDALLQTFIEVCEGVDYAHRRGIVHRDLKPSNVRLDAEGRPKVLDFGLAKNVAGDAELAALTATATGTAFLGSLPWASPEQALGRNRAIDCRSDVYALGVVLYQLLTKHFPYDVESDLKTALDAIVNHPPLRPRRWAPELHADLETIVLRCLQKEPDRRYASAADVARDLERYLAGEAIEARRDSTWYLLRTTARRHRSLFASAILIILALAAGLVASLIQWQRADTERLRAQDHAEREAGARRDADAERTLAQQSAERARIAQADAEEGRRLAQENARRAEAAMKYFADTLVAVDPDRDGPETKVLDLVLRAAGDLKNRFPADPDTRDFFYIKLIELLRNLGARTEAFALADEALASARAEFGEAEPHTIFARANRALLLHQAGRSRDAASELESCAEIVRTDLDRYRIAGYHVFTTLGSALVAIDRVDDAERAFREGLALEEGATLAPHQIAVGHETLAAIAGYRGNYAEAIRLLRIAVALRTESIGPEHSMTRNAEGNLAFYLAETGALEEALGIMERLVEVARRRNGEKSAHALSALNNRGNYFERLGRLDEAARDYAECLAGRLEVLGENHPHTIVTMGNVANLASLRKQYEEAEGHFRRVIEISTRERGEAHTDTLILRNNYAFCLGEQERLDEAIAEQTDIASKAREALGAEHFQTALFLGNLGGFHLRKGDLTAAEPELRESVRVLELRLGPAAKATAGMRGRLIELLKATDRAAEAEAVQAKARERAGGSKG